MTRRFAVSFDYRCPFARNAHESVVAGLRAGRDWDVTFVPFSLDQVHVEEGEPPVWERDPAEWGTGTRALLWGIAVRSMLHHLRPRANVVERVRNLRGSPSASAEEEVLARVEHSDVGLAFSRLSPDLQAVVQATVLDGLTTREAAALLGIPSGTVKSRMSRARTELREGLL